MTFLPFFHALRTHCGTIGFRDEGRGRCRSLPYPAFAIWAAPAAAPALWTPQGRTPAGTVLDAETLARHTARDLVENPRFFLLRLLLVRAEELFRPLASDLRDGEPDRDLAPELARARELEQTLAIAEKFDPGLAPLRDSSRELANDLDHAHALKEPAADLARRRPVLLEQAEKRPEKIASGLERGRGGLSEHPLLPLPDRLLGTALAHALPRALAAGEGTQGSSFPGALADGLVEKARAGEPCSSLSFGSLAESVPSARTLAQKPPEAAEAAYRSWLGRSVRGLESLAEPVFCRRERPTEEQAASIRLYALCLAAEAEDPLGAPALGRDLCDIAIGVTLLQRRLRGEAPAPETILLAANQRPPASASG